MSMGGPQGSVIGPFLFNIFMNEIVESRPKLLSILNADDKASTSTFTLDIIGNNPKSILKNASIKIYTKMVGLE